MAASKTQTVPVPARRRFSPWWAVAGGAILVVVGIPAARFYSVSPWFAPQLVISEETTVITRPLTPQGLPDYAEYLHRLTSQGVTSENNAAVPLVELLGPKILRAPEYRRLGMKPPPEGTPLFLFLPERFGKELAAMMSQQEIQRYLIQLSRAAWPPEEEPEIARLLEENAAALALVRRASLRERFFLPYVPWRDKYWNLDNPPAGMCFSLIATDLVVRSTLYSGQHRVEDAWEDALTLQRLGRLAAQGYFANSQEDASALHEMAFRAIKVLLENCQLDGPTAEKFLDQWRALPPGVSAARTANRPLRFALLRVLQKASRGDHDELHMWFVTGQVPVPLEPESPDYATLDYNYACKRANHYVDQFVKLLGQEKDVAALLRRCDRYQQELLRPPDKLEQAIAWLNRAARTEWVVRPAAFVVLKWSLWDKCQELYTRQRFLLAETALALAVYQARHGEYPERLQALVPELLPRVPPDLFTGGPLAYRRTSRGYVLWSRGLEQEEFLSRQWIREMLESDEYFPPVHFSKLTISLALQRPGTARR